MQTQLFHDRRQGPRETVDDFAQELRKLYYSAVTCGTPEAEKVGQTVLVSQFVAGLHPEVQVTVVGMDGMMDQLVLKARFGEAKGKELAMIKTNLTQKKLTTVSPPTSSVLLKEMGSFAAGPPSGLPKSDKSNKKCYNCGVEGHMARVCPYPKASRDEKEAHGRRVSNITGKEDTGREARKEKIAVLRKELREAELSDAINQAAGELRTMTSTGDDAKTKLGATIFTPIEVNGVSTTALVDTWSPATIISLEFVMGVLVGQRTPDQTPSQWQQASERQVPCIFGRRVGDWKVLGRAQSKPRKSPGEDSRSWTTFEAKEVLIRSNGGGVSGAYCVCGWSLHRCKKGGNCQGLPATERCEETLLFSRFGILL